MKIDELKSILFSDSSGIDFEFLMDKAPEEVVKYFKGKGLVLTDSWRDTLKYLDENIFTVAGVTKMEILQDVYTELLGAIENGVPLKTFQKNLEALFIKKGWTNDENPIMENPWRVNTIYRQNIQNAYQAGRMKQQLSNQDRPYLQYIGVLDRNTRPTHKLMQEFFADKVLNYSHKLWKIWYPPCGFFCRCRVRSYSLKQVQQLGLIIVKRVPSNILKLQPDEGFEHRPDESFIFNIDKYDPSIANQFKKGA